MNHVSYPSESAPGPVPVSVDLPDGWMVHPAPGVAFLAVSPDEVGGAHANVVVSVRRVAAELSLEDLSGLIGNEIAEIPGAIVTDERTVTIGERPTAVRQFEVTGDDGGSAYQLQAVCMAPVNEHVADAVTVTLSVADASQLAGEDSLQSIINSVRVG